MPAEPFDPTLLFERRVDHRSRVSVRLCTYSVPARYVGRRLAVRLSATTVQVLDGPRVVACHERAIGRHVEVLALDHYLEVLARKPGAFPAATALAQAKACRAFTGSHQRYWDACCAVRGDSSGTRALVEVLLAHRTLPAPALIEAMDKAVTSGTLNPDVVLIGARPPAGRPLRHPRRRGRADMGASPLRPGHAVATQLRRPPHAGSNPMTSDTAAEASITAAAHQLRLPTVRTEAVRLAEVAARQHQTHLAYLAEVLAAEVDDRTERRRSRRINDAKFPRIKRLADFNVDAVPSINAATISHLASGAYLEAGEPVVLLGDSGTGKTHLLIGLGLAACEQGRRVRYVTTAQLVNELVEAADERMLSRVVARYARLDLLLCDELGYVKVDPRGAELLFQIITARDERASIGLATNLPFSEWGSVFPDPRLVAAIVDRVTFNAHILETGAQSYRLRTSKTSRRRST